MGGFLRDARYCICEDPYSGTAFHCKNVMVLIRKGQGSQIKTAIFFLVPIMRETQIAEKLEYFVFISCEQCVIGGDMSHTGEQIVKIG